MTKITFLLILEVGYIYYIYNCVCLDTEQEMGLLVLNKINDSSQGKVS